MIYLSKEAEEFARKNPIRISVFNEIENNVKKLSSLGLVTQISLDDYFDKLSKLPFLFETKGLCYSSNADVHKTPATMIGRWLVNFEGSILGIGLVSFAELNIKDGKIQSSVETYPIMIECVKGDWIQYIYNFVNQFNGDNS